MPDHAIESLKRIKESGDYVLVPGVALFDEHSEFDEDGNLIRRFGREELQEICDNTNKRAENGDLAIVGLGHTIPRDPVTKKPAPEKDQPEPVGYGENLRVGTFGPQQKTGILGDLWIPKDRVEETKTYPRRSIELWPKTKIIDWIALLRKAPQRDLGLLTYSKDGVTPFKPKRRYFGDDDHIKPLTMAQRGEKLFYAMDFDESKHPRADDGKFGQKSGSKAAKGKWTVTAVDEHGDTYSETVDAASKEEAEETAHRIFVRDLSNRKYKIHSTERRDNKTSDSKQKYAMDSHLEEVEDIDQNDDQNVDSDGQNENTMDPTKPPDAMAPDDDFCQKIDRYMAEKYPVLKRMCDEATQKYAMESNPGAVGAPEGAKLDPTQNSPAPNLGGNDGDAMPPGEGMPDEDDSTGEDEEGQTGPGFPGATDTAIPGSKKKKKKGNPMADDKAKDDAEKKRMAADGEAIRYARLEEEVKQLREARIADQLAAKKAKATQRIQSLQFQGFTLDPAREVERYCALDEATWDKEDEHIKLYYKQDSVGMVPMGGMVPTEGMKMPTTKEKGRMSESQMRQAVSLTSSKGMKFEDAAAQVLAGQV